MIGREWREAVDMRTSTLGIAGVVAVAAALRFWRLTSGVPYDVGVDEPAIVARAVSMMKTGQYHPHFFDYPALLIYLNLLVSVVRFVLGATSGAWASLAAYGTSDLYPWARALTALFGTATVVLVYQIGMRWGSRHALLAASLLAVAPLHVRESHFVLTDVPMTFFVAATLLAALAAHERPSFGSFAITGACAGLAAATKYNGGIALLLPWIAAWMMGPAKVGRAPAIAVSTLACGVAFLVGAPYTVLDLPAFLSRFASLNAEYLSGTLEPPWLIYLRHLRLSFGWVGMGLVLGGLVFGLVRAFTGPGHVRWVLLVSFPLVHFCVIASRSIVYGRYLMPALPAFCLLAGIAVVSGVSLLRRVSVPGPVRSVLIAGLAVGALLPPLVSSVHFDRELGRPTSRQAAWTWVRGNVPPGARVVVEQRALYLPEQEYDVHYVRRLTDRPLDEWVRDRYTWMISSSDEYDVPAGTPLADAYANLFGRSLSVQTVPSTGGDHEPEIRIVKLQ